MKFRTGIGFDIHKFAKGRKLILGGVEIPYEKGLEGHSDADVVLHAVCDALLGALAKGDIGEHFPNTDPKYKGASSLGLLEKVSALVKKEGYTISNVDVIIQAQEPKLAVYKPQMRFHIAHQLALHEDQVNVKATTMETLGAIGKKEGIAAFASVLLTRE